MAIVIANCWYSFPAAPGISPTGRKTAIRTVVIATIDDDTLFIAACVASLAFMPCSRLTCTASTTTMASSTTSPMANTRPSRENTLTENPNSGKSMKAPINATGITINGTKVARKSCRKR